MTKNGYIVLADNPADGTWAAECWGGADFAIFTGGGCKVRAFAKADSLKRDGFRNVRVLTIDTQEVHA